MTSLARPFPTSTTAANTTTTTTTTLPSGRPFTERTPKRKPNAPRPEIWSKLLRQTREAQARSRTQAIQHRSLLICGGSPADQRAFLQGLARPPPPTPPGRNRDERSRKARGELRLSNRYAYGYGHVTLYSPPAGQGVGAGLLGGESEEVVALNVHTLPDAEAEYEGVLRRVIGATTAEEGVGDEPAEGEGVGGRRPGVALLLTWKEPWNFLGLLRKWLQLLARSLLPPDAPPEDPVHVLKERGVALTVVVQHVEAQEGLEREGYREEVFDYIAQCLRTTLLPLAAALVYTSSNPIPQQPGSPLSDVQKVLYTSLELDLGPLSPAPAKRPPTAKRDDLAPKHNVVDRMAMVVPTGWDSLGKIRLLSETFSPESMLETWMLDLNTPTFLPKAPEPVLEDPSPQDDAEATKGASPSPTREETEVYATSEPDSSLDIDDTPTTPSKSHRPSAISTYESQIQDPHAHRAPKPPTIEVTTKPTQEFLAEMRIQLQKLEAQDAEKARSNANTTASSASSGGRAVGVPAGESTGALNQLGDVSFNVGGVSYNAISAEAAIERLKRPQPPQGEQSPSVASSSPRTSTPRPPGRRTGGEREERERAKETPKGGEGEMSLEELERYFSSLAKKAGGSGGGTGSGSSTPSKPPK